MKKILYYSGIALFVFIIGGAGGLFVDYVIFSKVTTHPVWSEYGIIKALDNRVKVIKNTEKIVVEEHESIADIANRASTTVVYVEVVHADASRVSGNGVVVSSDGVVATTVGGIDQEDTVYVRLSDNTIHTAQSFFTDPYTGITFLTVDVNDLATISFANSDDARSGKQLISIMQSRVGNDMYFASGGLVGHAHDTSIAAPKSNHLQGVLKVDFSDSVFEMGIGSPVVDYHGNMIGVIAKKESVNTGNPVVMDTEYYAIAANDVYKAFEDFLRSVHNKEPQKHVLLGVDYDMISSMDVYTDTLSVDSGAKIVALDATYQQKAAFHNTLAARSGLRVDDIVIMVGTQVVDSTHNLSRLLHDAEGNQVVLQVMRGEKLVPITVRVPE